MSKQITLTVCETCGYDPAQPDAARPGAALASLFEAGVNDAVRIKRTRCLMSCERPCALALQIPGKYSYVVCDLPVSQHTVDALHDFAQCYLASDDGTVAWSEWPDLLKGRFAARLPPATNAHEQ